MAFLYVTEFVVQGRYQGAGVPVGDTGTWTENTNSPIAISGSAANSAKFGTNTTLIRVHCDVICSIIVTTAGTSATTNNARMAANQTEYFAVRPGQIISVISNT